MLLHWFAEEVIKSLPVPENQVLYVIADGSKKDKRGPKNPATQKGRLNEHHAWFFGIKFVVLMVAWDDYRIPVDFQMVLPKGHPDYKKENELFRHMLSHFQPPDWAKVVIVVGDAAFAAKDNMKLIQARDKADSQRRWGTTFFQVDQAKPKNQGFLRHLQKCRAHPNLDRLDRIPASGLAQVQEQGGLGTPGTHPPGPNQAPGALGAVGDAWSSTTG
ncbi:MAG: hypothetical protein KJ822_07670 [Proteobacteria bacterium]|nr:hypothetical protein [Pseudomonadota bacterium]